MDNSPVSHEQLLCQSCLPADLGALLRQQGLHSVGLRPKRHRLAACRTCGVESENRPQRGQLLPHSPPHSPAMGQEGGEKWTAALDLLTDDSQVRQAAYDHLISQIALSRTGNRGCPVHKHGLRRGFHVQNQKPASACASKWCLRINLVHHVLAPPKQKAARRQLLLGLERTEIRRSC